MIPSPWCRPSGNLPARKIVGIGIGIFVDLGGLPGLETVVPPVVEEPHPPSKTLSPSRTGGRLPRRLRP